MKYLKYLRYILIHKWYVFIECCKLGIPLRGIMHDMSKLRPSEFFPYAEYFYGKPRLAFSQHFFPEYMPKDCSRIENVDMEYCAMTGHNIFYYRIPDRLVRVIKKTIEEEGTERSSRVFNDCGLPDVYVQAALSDHRVRLNDSSVIVDEDHAQRVNMAFDMAWLLHQHRNSHHWQSYVLRCDDGETKILPMPESVIREMIADWRGAGKAITGKDNTTEWYHKNKDKMMLHQDTRKRVEELLFPVNFRSEGDK